MQIPDNWQPRKDLLKERIILVTGAGTGIGAAVAKSCARYGATVILLDKVIRNLEQVYDAIESASAIQPAIYPMNLEGAAEKDYQDLATTIEKEFGRLDGLLHNAAMLGALFILDDPIFSGLAVSLIFGILVSTVLTLLVIPVLYYAAIGHRLQTAG